jgi:putative flippase GtrA
MKIKKEISRFLMAGVIVNAVDFSIYYALYHFMFFSIAKTISFTCAGVVGYLLNKHWTFEMIQPSYAEAGRYLFVNVVALGCNVLTNQLVLSFWHGAIFPALIIASLATGSLTFVCFKWWVF